MELQSEISQSQTRNIGDDTMCKPFRLELQLRNIPPPGVWSRAQHEEDIDVLFLVRKKQLKVNGRVIEFLGQPAICKIAPFELEFRRLEMESWAYRTLDEFFSKHKLDKPIAPKMLGHVAESGRVIGLLLEKVEDTFASIEDLESCEEVLRRLHAAGIVHGDVNRYNFIVNRQSGEVRLVDFEHAERYDEDNARLELESLPLELVEETGRGKPVTFTT